MPTSCKAALATHKKRSFEVETTAEHSGVGGTDTGEMKLGAKLALLKN